MKYCPNCGAPFEVGQKFCGNCGAKLPQEVELPKEPVYTDDPALLNDPVLNRPDELSPRPKEEKVPELTLEPDLWGLGAAATAAAAAAPAQAAEAPQAAEPAVQAPSFSTVMEGIEYERDDRPDPNEYHGQGVGAEEPTVHQSTAQSSGGAQTSYDNVPNDYTMSQDNFVNAQKMPNETWMLIWGIVLSLMCSIPGIVGLVKVVKARKMPDWALKLKLYNSAKIWLLVGTALYVLGYIGYGFADLFPNFGAFYTGVLITSLFRLGCSTLAGCIVWESELMASLSYNASYMIPTMLVDLILVPLLHKALKPVMGK